MDELIPIVLFLTIGATFVLAFYYKYRTRHDIQNTVRSAIERGDPLSPEIIETLAMSLSSPYADLRRGVISVALGIAVFIFARLIGEPDVQGPLMALAMFPILIGVAYLGLWAFIGRRNLPRRFAEPV